MKNQRIHLRASDTDNLNLVKAAKNLEVETGEKQTTSKTIRTAVEMVAENKPDLFFSNRSAIRAICDNIEQGRKNLQTLSDEFVKVAGEPFTITEIQNLFGTGRSDYGVCDREQLRQVVTLKLYAIQKEKYPGLQFSIDNVIIPDLTLLTEAASKLMLVTMVEYRDAFYWECYTIQEGKIILNPEVVENVKDFYRCAAITPDERKKLSKVRGLCEYLSKFLDDTIQNPEKLNIPGVLYFDVESNRFEPSERYIKFGL